MTWLITASGRKVDILKPDLASICIEDIAHALALQCRFNGHTRVFYSVAQHSVECSWIAKPAYAMECLLHDAAEAYLGDIVSPLKSLMDDSVLPTLEMNFEATITEALDLAVVPGYYREVRRVDLIMLATEKRDLLPYASINNQPWPQLRGVQPLDDAIEPWTSQLAEAKFLERYKELRA